MTKSGGKESYQNTVEDLQKKLQQGKEFYQNTVEDLQKEFQQEKESLRKELEMLKNALNLCCSINQSKSAESDESINTQEFDLADPTNAYSETMRVYQNAPNPFNERTTIQCYIPQTIKKVELCVYNMQGIQIKCLPISERGTVDIQIQAGQLSSGVYNYLLIGDNKTSDTKQMILTK